MSDSTGNRNNYRLYFFCVILLPGFGHAFSQQINLSVKDVLQKVQTDLPKLEVLRQQASAYRQNIALAKNTLVPDLTVGYQAGIATFNNITGMSYPGFLLPISGPPSVGNNLNFVPGSAAGALVKWNPVSFGQRPAAIGKATAEFNHATAVYNEELFQYQYAALNIYLEAVYYKQLLNSEQAAVARNNAGLEQSLVLAKAGLRQGIDTAQFQSALAQAEIDVMQTERTYQQKIIELSRLAAISISFERIVLTDTVFNIPADLIVDSVFNIFTHPYYQTLEAQKTSTIAGLKEIQKSWVPQFDVWGNMYARGSGIDASGRVNKSDGLNLSRTNAGIGFQLSFPVLQYSKMSIKKKQYQSLLKADDAGLKQAQLDISKEAATALQQLKQDIKIAAKSPVLLKTATDVYDGLKLSYETGLIDYTRLAQAQFELVRAEVNNASTRLQLWRSLLAVAVAKGDLNLFTDQLK